MGRPLELEVAAGVLAQEASGERGQGTGERTTTVEALLGVLSLRPMSGYEIRKLIEESIGNFWSESFGQIYPALRRMVADGLAEVEESAGEGRPVRKVYRLTDAGLDRLVAWIAQSPRPQVPRNDLLLRIFFGVQGGPAVVMQHLHEFVAEQRRLHAHYEGILAQVEAMRAANRGAPYWRLTVRYGLLQTEALIAWAEESLQAMEQIT